MKLFKNKTMVLRLIAAAEEAILFYLGYTLVSLIVGAGRINMLFFLIVAICGLLVNLLPYNSYDKRKHTLIFGSIGLILSVLAIGISSINDFNLFTLPTGFVALVFLYYRSYTNYLASILYVYSIDSFYKSVGFLFLANLFAVFFSRTFGAASDELVRYSILYIIVALYMLSEIKNFRYVSRSENMRKTAFETIATGLMIFVTVVISIPRVFKLVVFPFVSVFKLVHGLIAKGVMLITYPIAWVLSYIYDLFPRSSELGSTNKLFGNMLDMSQKYHGLVSEEPSPIVQLIGKVLTTALLLSICVYAVYLLFKFIDKITRTEDEEDFTEDREFILGSDKKKGPGLISRLADSMKKATDSIAFMFTADNSDKLRNEYKNFIQKLHDKKLIEHYNYTAQDILQLLLPEILDHKSTLGSITEMYEEVRYGAKYPKDSELKNFKKSLAEVSKVIANHNS